MNIEKVSNHTFCTWAAQGRSVSCSYRGSTAVELTYGNIHHPKKSWEKFKHGTARNHKTFLESLMISGFSTLHLPVKKRELIEIVRFTVGKKSRNTSDGSLNESDETFLLKPQVPKFFHMRNPSGKVQQTNTDPKGTINIQRCYWCSTVQTKSLPAWRFFGVREKRIDCCLVGVS